MLEVEVEYESGVFETIKNVTRIAKANDGFRNLHVRGEGYRVVKPEEIVEYREMEDQ